jgi:predicted MFS family arabinose efflux permease
MEGASCRQLVVTSTALDVRASRRRGLVASLTATIAANLPVFFTGSLAVQLQRDLGFGDAALGLAVGTYYAVGAVGSPWTGRVVERLGAQRALRLGAVVSAAGQILIALAVHQLWLLILLLAIGGLANSLAQPASNVYLAGLVPQHRLGLALGIQKSAIPAAALVGGLAVPIAADVGWRWAFAAGAAFALFAAYQVPQEPAGTVRKRVDRTAVPDVATSTLMILAVGVGFGSSASNALSAFLVRGGVEAGLGESGAAGLLVIGSILGIGVRLLFGHRADGRPGRTLAFMVGLFAVAAVTFVLLSFEETVVFVVATPLAFATAYAWPGLFHLAVVRSNPSAPGVATGIAMTGTLAGAVGGPLVFGVLAEHVNFTAAWLSSAGFCVLACLFVAAADRRISEPARRAA